MPFKVGLSIQGADASSSGVERSVDDTDMRAPGVARGYCWSMSSVRRRLKAAGSASVPPSASNAWPYKSSA